MVFAEKGNRVRRIDESEIQRYAEQGYEITDGKGTVLRETVPTDVPNLKLAYIEHTKEIAELKAQIAALTAENKALKTENAAPTGAAKDTSSVPKKKSKATDKVDE